MSEEARREVQHPTPGAQERVWKPLDLWIFFLTFNLSLPLAVLLTPELLFGSTAPKPNISIMEH